MSGDHGVSRAPICDVSVATWSPHVQARAADQDGLTNYDRGTVETSKSGPAVPVLVTLGESARVALSTSCLGHWSITQRPRASLPSRPYVRRARRVQSSPSG
ncbi:Translation initiation factor IF-2 [Modestobacter italicus]|uniref:Translation initiation factor IF-2 n=1 Tax=Modestobacter italicus (strain DSM 44449 / CECT 9708 / BC 501) TaxID=2732864 RepID=I4F1F7_MODI5|nr:Translation initiation factor IF-2 [Modestobacter marinus]